MMTDFDSIEDDFQFFLEHTSEHEDVAQNIAAKLNRRKLRGQLSILDFGSGDGSFLDRLLSLTQIQIERIVLVEPAKKSIEAARELFEERKIPSIETRQSLEHPLSDPVDLILCNHSLYYSREHLDPIEILIQSLKTNGLGFVTLASKENLLVQMAKDYYRKIGKAYPHRTATEIEGALLRLTHFRVQNVPSPLQFIDTPENREKILRFVLHPDFERGEAEEALQFFDAYSSGTRVDLPLSNSVWEIEPGN